MKRKETYTLDVLSGFGTLYDSIKCYSVWFDVNSSQRHKKNQRHSYHLLEIPRIRCTELYNNKKIDKFKEPMAWSFFTQTEGCRSIVRFHEFCTQVIALIATIYYQHHATFYLEIYIFLGFQLICFEYGYETRGLFNYNIVSTLIVTQFQIIFKTH